MGIGYKWRNEDNKGEETPQKIPWVQNWFFWESCGGGVLLHNIYTCSRNDIFFYIISRELII